MTNPHHASALIFIQWAEANGFPGTAQGVREYLRLSLPSAPVFPVTRTLTEVPPRPRPAAARRAAIKASFSAPPFHVEDEQ